MRISKEKRKKKEKNNFDDNLTTKIQHALLGEEDDALRNRITQ